MQKRGFRQGHWGPIAENVLFRSVEYVGHGIHRIAGVDDADVGFVVELVLYGADRVDHEDRTPVWASLAVDAV